MIHTLSACLIPALASAPLTVAKSWAVPSEPILVKSGARNLRSKGNARGAHEA